MLLDKDLEQLKSKGISPEMLDVQIENFKRGFDFVELEAPATPEDGLLVISEEERKALLTYFEEEMKNRSALKFVPASGAASRMFKALFEFYEKLQNGNEVDQLFEDEGFNSPYQFFENLEKFAFYPPVKEDTFGAWFRT